MRNEKTTAGSQLEQLTSGQERRLRFAAILATLAEALWPVQALLIAIVIAALIGGVEPWMGLISVCLGFALIGLIRAGLSAWAGRDLMRAGDAVTGELRAKLLRRTDRQGALTGAAHSAAVAALATDKLALLLPYLRRWPVARMRVVVIPLLIIAIALPISWVVALIFAVTGPMIPVFMALVGMAAGKASQDRMEEIADMNSLLVERLTALIDIRLLSARDTMLEEFGTVADRLRIRTMRVLALAFLSSTVLELFAAIGIAMTAVFVGFSLLDKFDFGSWGGDLEIGQGVFLLLLAPAFYQPMRDLAAAWHDRADALALARDLEVEMTRKVEPILGEGGQAPPLSFAELRLQGIALNDRELPDICILRGEAIALTGPSGAGKTRLIAMLAGLTEVAPGQVMIDGHPLTSDIVDGWRASLALIPQRVHFGDDTLLVNLTGGKTLPEERMQAALKMAQLQDVVARLPEGLQTRLGEQGFGVSGGEARRLMIARAALRQPQLLLADEPTADLDEATAFQVIQGLLKLHQAGATLIVATHDPRLIAALTREVAI